jgi:hypothetical protein
MLSQTPGLTGLNSELAIELYPGEIVVRVSFRTFRYIDLCFSVSGERKRESVCVCVVT